MKKCDLTFGTLYTLYFFNTAFWGRTLTNVKPAPGDDLQGAHMYVPKWSADVLPAVVLVDAAVCDVCKYTKQEHTAFPH